MVKESHKHGLSKATGAKEHNLRALRATAWMTETSLSSFVVHSHSVLFAIPALSPQPEEHF